MKALACLVLGVLSVQAFADLKLQPGQYITIVNQDSFPKIAQIYIDAKPGTPESNIANCIFEPGGVAKVDGVTQEGSIVATIFENNSESLPDPARACTLGASVVLTPSITALGNVVIAPDSVVNAIILQETEQSEVSGILSPHKN